MVCLLNLLATSDPSTEVQNYDISFCNPQAQLDYTDLYQEWRIKSVDFQIIYPGEQDTPLCSVELATSMNYAFDNQAAPATMLLSMFDDYSVVPIPASHMIRGSVNLSSIMKARGAVWSKVGSNDYYGEFATTTTPFFIIRTNFFGVTAAGQLYG